MENDKSQGMLLIHAIHTYGLYLHCLQVLCEEPGIHNEAGQGRDSVLKEIVVSWEWLI